MNGLAGLIKRLVGRDHHPEGSGQLHVVSDDALIITGNLRLYLVLPLSKIIGHLFLYLGKPVLIGGGIHHPHLASILGSQADLHLSICYRFFIGTIANKYTECRRRPGSQVFGRKQECLLRLGAKIVHLIGLQSDSDADQNDHARSDGPKTPASQPACLRFDR